MTNAKQTSLTTGNQNIIRCAWGDSKLPAMRDYHDNVWGKFTTDDRTLFEYLTLEIFQAGLSWSTIIKRQSAFKEAFRNYDIAEIAQFTDEDLEQLMKNDKIIRNRLKINATINNAQIVKEIISDRGSFNNYLKVSWPTVVDNQPINDNDVPSSSTEAVNFSKQLKKAGFKFVGPTIVYSFLQATGRINDHITSCSFKY